MNAVDPQKRMPIGSINLQLIQFLWRQYHSRQLDGTRRIEISLRV